MQDTAAREEPILLTLKDAMSLTQLSRSKAYGLCRSGVWPSFKVGRVVRIPRQSLEEWIEREMASRPNGPCADGNGS